MKSKQRTVRILAAGFGLLGMMALAGLVYWVLPDGLRSLVIVAVTGALLAGPISDDFERLPRPWLARAVRITGTVVFFVAVGEALHDGSSLCKAAIAAVVGLGVGCVYLIFAGRREARRLSKLPRVDAEIFAVASDGRSVGYRSDSHAGWATVPPHLRRVAQVASAVEGKTVIRYSYTSSTGAIRGARVESITVR